MRNGGRNEKPTYKKSLPHILEGINGEADEDVESRIRKVKGAFRQHGTFDSKITSL